MITADIAPFAGTVGGGFFLGFIAGWAIKKVRFGQRLSAQMYLNIGQCSTGKIAMIKPFTLCILYSKQWH